MKGSATEFTASNWLSAVFSGLYCVSRTATIGEGKGGGYVEVSCPCRMWHCRLRRTRRVQRALRRSSGRWQPSCRSWRIRAKMTSENWSWLSSIFRRSTPDSRRMRTERTLPSTTSLWVRELFLEFLYSAVQNEFVTCRNSVKKSGIRVAVGDWLVGVISVCGRK